MKEGYLYPQEWSVAASSFKQCMGKTTELVMSWFSSLSTPSTTTGTASTTTTTATQGPKYFSAEKRNDTEAKIGIEPKNGFHILFHKDVCR